MNDSKLTKLSVALDEISISKLTIIRDKLEQQGVNIKTLDDVYAWIGNEYLNKGIPQNDSNKPANNNMIIAIFILIAILVLFVLIQILFKEKNEKIKQNKGGPIARQSTKKPVNHTTSPPADQINSSQVSIETDLVNDNTLQKPQQSSDTHKTTKEKIKKPKDPVIDQPKFVKPN